MKKILLSPVILFAVFISLSSCQKEIPQSEVIKEITIDTAMAVGSHYILQLAAYGEEGDVANIIDQPSFAATSRIENESDMFTSLYHYTPLANAAGKTDHVTLAISRACNQDSTIIYVNIAVK